MTLEMRSTCERCGAQRMPEDPAWTCVHGCQFRTGCTESVQHGCPHCGGEPVRRPRPAASNA